MLDNARNWWALMSMCFWCQHKKHWTEGGFLSQFSHSKRNSRMEGDLEGLMAKLWDLASLQRRNLQDLISSDKSHIHIACLITADNLFMTLSQHINGFLSQSVCRGRGEQQIYKLQLNSDCPPHMCCAKSVDHCCV